MSSRSIVCRTALSVQTLALFSSVAGFAQTPMTLPEQQAADAPPSVDQLMANTRRFLRVRTAADCRDDASQSDDIVVCGAPQDDGLPVPEVYGPVRGSTDGAAVDPHGVPCGASISNNCYGGVDLIITATAAVDVIQLLLDPDRNLGEGTPIPRRFRGANP